MASIPSVRQRAAVIYNPVRINANKFFAEVAKAEKSYHWASSLRFPTSKDSPGATQALQALAAKVSVIIVAGGDGTVRQVAEVLRGTGTPLCLVPIGTGNLLARNLGIGTNSTHLTQNIRAAFTGANRAIDVGLIALHRPSGQIETHSFLVLAGVGLDAQMVGKTRPALKKRFGWLAYVDAIGRSLVDRRAIRLHYRINGVRQRPARAHTAMVGNCGILPGNVLLLPDARIDDSLLDMLLLRPTGLTGWLRVWLGIVWENGVLRRSTVGRKILGLRSRPFRALRYLQAENFAVDFDKTEECEIDGDAFGQITGFHARVDPASLLVKLS